MLLSGQFVGQRMQGELRHATIYDFDGEATVAEVAASLVGQEKLMRDAVQVLEACFAGLTIQELRVAVRTVSQASPLESDLRAFVVGVYAAELGTEMPDVLQAIFGIDVPDTYDGIVSVIVLLLALHGIEIVRKKIMSGIKSAALERERKRLTKQAADQIHVTEEHLEEAVERVLSRRHRSIARASLEVLSPAKRHHARSVRAADAEITEDAIKAVPSDVDLEAFEPPIETETLEDVVVNFHVHDRDKSEKWAATIEAVSKARKTLHLAPYLSRDALFDKRSVRGDVIVTSTRAADGEYVPTLYYLSQVHNDQPA